MKKTLAIILFTLASLSAFAGSQADLIIKGMVAPLLNIEVLADNTAANLDLLNAANDVKVATLVETSNYSTGYKIKARSINGGKLVNTSDAQSYVVYSLSYNGSQIPLNSSATVIYSSTSAKGTFSKDLKVSYQKPSNLSAGSHEDIVQFTIEAN